MKLRFKTRVRGRVSAYYKLSLIITKRVIFCETILTFVVFYLFFFLEFKSVKWKRNRKGQKELVDRVRERGRSATKDD